MIVEEVDGSQEREILIGMIVDPTVVGRLSAKWQKNSLRSRHSNAIASWAIEHWKKFSKPIGRAVKLRFEEWAKGQRDKSVVEQAGNFLGALDGEYKRKTREINPAHVVELAARYINALRLERVAQGMDLALKSGDEKRAQEVLATFHKVDFGSGVAVNPFRSEAMIQAAFARSQDQIVTYPKALGRFFGTALTRGGFVCFEGPAKSGKSFWLTDLAYRAMCQRRRVLFVEAGDNTEEEFVQRLMCRAAMWPLDSPDGKWPCVIEVPKEIHPPSGLDVAPVNKDRKKFKCPLDVAISLKACKETSARIKSHQDYFRLACYPNSSINVAGIDALLDEQKREGYDVDVLVLDYMDILDNPPGLGRGEEREIINTNVKHLRRISQDRHLLLVTASQTDTESYDKRTIGKRNFSGDRRKRDHVTATIGINVTEDEKVHGITRLNWVVRRRGSENRQVHVAGCLALANPAMVSTFGKREGGDD
jgi:hypothetical protein